MHSSCPACETIHFYQITLPLLHRQWRYNDQVEEFYIILEDNRSHKKADQTRNVEETQLAETWFDPNIYEFQPHPNLTSGYSYIDYDRYRKLYKQLDVHLHQSPDPNGQPQPPSTALLRTRHPRLRQRAWRRIWWISRKKCRPPRLLDLRTMGLTNDGV